MIGRLSYQGILRLVLAHWWVEPGPGFLTIRIWGTDLVLVCWLVGLGPVSYTHLTLPTSLRV